MRPFRPKLFQLLDLTTWWWHSSPLARMVWLTLLREACAYGTARTNMGICGISQRSGSKNDTDAALAAIEELKVAGAITEVDDPDWRFVYNVVDFQKYADALDTHRAAARASYNKTKKHEDVA